MTGVILAAGFGTRFLPVTKSVPKELFPILGNAAIDYIIQEFKQASIDRLFIVTSRRKTAVEAYFDRDIELENRLDGKPTVAQLTGYSEIPVAFVRQEEMRGTGHALLMLRPFIQDDPFIVAYPDDIVHGSNISLQLIDAYKQTGANVLSCVTIDPADSFLYGMVELGSEIEKDFYYAKSIVEKPKSYETPSNWASIGRYLYTPRFFDNLAETWRDFRGTGEFYHVDALNLLGAKKQVVATKVKGTRHDIGNMEGYLKFLTKIAYEQGYGDCLNVE
jgi:UTP--glucose-1-phosphate uridylyltransferase